MSCQLFSNKYGSAQNQLQTSKDHDDSMDREVFEEQYYKTKTRLLELLHTIESPNVLESAPKHNVSIKSSTSGSAHIRLPIIELPKFSGDECKWMHFRDTFQVLVIETKHYLTYKNFTI
jgi:hypothetical protein